MRDFDGDVKMIKDKDLFKELGGSMMRTRARKTNTTSVVLII